jgi:hypothetical protein
MRNFVMANSKKVSTITLLSTSALTPHPNNPRKHTLKQMRALSVSMDTFGFNAPILIDKNRQIVAGHGRFEAAKLLGYSEVPVVSLDHLSPEKAKAYMLADNQLTDRSSWDDAALAVHLKELSELALDFNIEATGFEAPNIDFRIQSIEDADSVEKSDEFEFAVGSAVSAPGDLWILGENRIRCGNALEKEAYEDFFENEKAAAAFTDPPYNVRIDGNVSGNGEITHREFPMASGEMSEAEHTNFLTTSLPGICAHTVQGALIYVCMDWRHIVEIHTAGRDSNCQLINLCVWAKNNGGLGSLYRSRHELVYVFKNGNGAYLNNVQLGRFGRNRTNVWNYAAVTMFGRGDLKFHPTVKPIRLVADAILD